MRLQLGFADLARMGPGAIEQGTPVLFEGWPCLFTPDAAATYLALVDEAPCCLGCLPRDPDRRIEVFARDAIPITGAPVRLAATFHHLTHDPAGWRYQLRDAQVVSPRTPAWPNRRRILQAASLACVAVASPIGVQAQTQAQTQPATTPEQVRQVLADVPTIDIHSHAGGAIGLQRVRTQAPFIPLAAPMRAGGMAVACLAAVSDSPTHHITPDRRFRPFRDPDPGELYEYGQQSFARIHDLIRDQGLMLVATAADLAGARAAQPAIVVSAEGADFLEGQVDRVEEAHARWTLRHLQLTHYRVNELGDIQTEPPVHGGLTATGAEVIRRCNRLGVVVDVAHGTFDLVKQAAAVATRPLVLSHTSLSRAPGPRSRLISADHARVIAETGGVIGIWPPASIFPDLAALAAGIARVVDVVGVAHVGLGTDLGGLAGPSTFGSYRDLPGLAAALLDRGFTGAEARLLLGGNYLRVFTACVG